jgi:hypothetical protein
MCLFLCHKHPVFATMGSVVQFELRYCDTSSLVFLLRIALASQSLLWFHMNFRIDFSVSVKNLIGILMGIALVL